MINEADHTVISEFQWLSKRLNSPAGFKRVINSISVAFSLQLTIVLQKMGINRNLSAKYNNRSLILNIGCGDALINDCVNCDVAPTLGGLLRILKGAQALGNKSFINITFNDRNLEGVADGIVFSHVLEHLPSHLAIPALLNVRRYLKQGGVLRLSVPCLKFYDQPRIPENQQLVTPILAKNRLIYGWGHQFMYDAELLLILLKHCGFTNVQEVSEGEGPLGHTDFGRRKGETIYLVAYA